MPTASSGCTQFIVTGTKWSYVSHGVRIIETRKAAHSFDEPIDDEYLEISQVTTQMKS